MASNAQKIAKKGFASPLAFSALAAAATTGLVYYNFGMHGKQKERLPGVDGRVNADQERHKSVEEQFGTADGYFPTATKGASLSNPPANKDKIAGTGYQPVVKSRHTHEESRSRGDR